MSTTTIRLTDDLKVRIARAAEHAGTTAHNFILEAIAEKAEVHERRTDSGNAAEKRHADIIASGKTIAWKDMRGYLEKRLAGKPAKRPTPGKLVR